MKAMAIIDVQKDFINPNGALYVPGAEKVKENIKKAIKYAKDNNFTLFFTADNHDGTEPEMIAQGGPFPPHCIEGTEGQENIDEATVDEAVMFDKKCYNVFDDTLGNFMIKAWLKNHNITEVVMVGVVGNICVEAAALGLVNEGIKVTIVEDSVVWMDISPENNEKVSREKLLKKGVTFIPTL